MNVLHHFRVFSVTYFLELRHATTFYMVYVIVDQVKMILFYNVKKTNFN